MKPRPTWFCVAGRLYVDLMFVIIAHSLFLLRKKPQKKKLSKKKMAICAHAARASAFEKAEQNLFVALASTNNVHSH